MAEDNKSPIEEAVDQALDLFVFAPLGLALTAREQLPALIAKGRQSATAQTAMAKMMGQFAVEEGTRQLRKQVDKLTAPPARSPRPTATPPPASSGETPAASTNGKAKPSPRATSASATPKPSSGHLAIPAYDTLAASQVVQRLAGLSADELASVQAYEESTRGRRTILTKIAQLQSEHA